MSSQPIETMRDRLRDNARRLGRLERMPQPAIILVPVSRVAVATEAEVVDAPRTASYVVATERYHFEGHVYTVAEWQAMHAES